MSFALFAVLGVLCIVAVNTAAPKVGVSAPLGLMGVGLAASLSRVVPELTVPPGWILGGVLPLLLYAASVSMPAMDFRRDFRSISGLSVSLVVLSSLALGVFFSRLIPGLGLAAGIALGAVISPTDAVATSIVKRLGVAPRAVAVLDGESLLNDASALVLLRSAVAAVATTVSLWSVARSFLTSIVIATAIGLVVGYGALLLRRRIPQPTVNTLLSFVVPFLAFEPAEHFEASGLVAVVTAGILVGHASPRYLAATHRHNDEQNWRTVELLLEGAVFLAMGLQILPLVEDVRAAHDSVTHAAILAAGALLITLVVRATFVTPMLWTLRRVRLRYETSRARFETKRDQLAAVEPISGNRHVQRRTERQKVWVRQVLADADFVANQPLGARHGVLLVWAGMRGAITLAAAQTLPADMPHRSLLVLIAFLVAAGSLLLQGSTLPRLVRWLNFPPPDPALRAREHTALAAALEESALLALANPELRNHEGAAYDAETIERLRGKIIETLHDSLLDPELGRRRAQTATLAGHVLEAQRTRLLDIRLEGACSSESLREALARVDALQISLDHGRH